jgi:putative addiction module component (TIGR02574 family)
MVHARPQVSRKPLASAGTDRVATILDEQENRSMARMTHEEIEQLTVAERVALVEEIWDSIAAAPERLPLTEAQRRELDRRLALHEQHPDRAIPWEEVRAKLQRES